MSHGKSTYEALQFALQRLIDTKADGVVTGSCTYIWGEVYALYSEADPDVVKELYRSLYIEWPEYSGNPYFPVSCDFYDDSLECKPGRPVIIAWDPEEEVGQARWRMVHWVLEKVKQELARMA